ncbi:MAG: hypothetical protein J6Z04_05880 [Clostridia bacterium]|nr:hypothetical protein [Clostridia bacterium]
MPTKVQIKKETAQKIKKANHSLRYAHKIKKAIVELNTIELPKLQKMGKVRKIDLPNAKSIYSFRLGMNERLLFSSIDNQILIHEIVDVKDIQSMGLLSMEKNDGSPPALKKNPVKN